VRGDTDSYANSVCYSYRDTNGYSYRDAKCYTDRDANCHAYAASPDAKAAAHAAPSADALSRIG